MNLYELREYMQAEIYNASDDTQLTIATRAGEALEAGIRINEALSALGHCPSASDFHGWDSWWSVYNRLVINRSRCDGALSVCLEVMGFDFRNVQNVIKQAANTY